MAKKKDFELGPGETNQETSDAAAEGGSDHNEALAQRPAGGEPTSGNQDDQAAIETLQRNSATMEALTTAGTTTTTTPDSVSGETAQVSDEPGSIDQMSAEERLEKVRGWAKNKRTSPPMSADWQDLDQILTSGNAGTVRRP